MAKDGSYLGTTVGGKWWHRYRAKRFFARGNGSLDLDDKGLRFKRLLLADEVTIPWSAMRGATLVSAHAGRWLFGRPILRVDWRIDDQDLSSGFYLGKDRSALQSVADDLNHKISSS